MPIAVLSPVAPGHLVWGTGNRSSKAHHPTAALSLRCLPAENRKSRLPATACEDYLNPSLDSSHEATGGQGTRHQRSGVLLREVACLRREHRFEPKHRLRNL